MAKYKVMEDYKSELNKVDPRKEDELFKLGYTDLGDGPAHAWDGEILSSPKRGKFEIAYITHGFTLTGFHTEFVFTVLMTFPQRGRTSIMVISVVIDEPIQYLQADVPFDETYLVINDMLNRLYFDTCNSAD